MPADTILIRSASSADAAAIERVARLDSARVPAGELLVAEVDGTVRAALRVDDHAVVADPFTRTAGLIDLLSARAEHLHGGRSARTRLSHWAQLWHRAAVLRPGV